MRHLECDSLCNNRFEFGRNENHDHCCVQKHLHFKLRERLFIFVSVITTEQDTFSLDTTEGTPIYPLVRPYV